MAKPIIKTTNLEITYNPGKENEFKAARGVNMDIYDGEFIAFFGSSGCGKSTIFNAILGILPPSGGELLVKGRNPYSLSPDEMVIFQTSVIGIIYQAFYLIPTLSIVDNVALPRIFAGDPPAERRKHAIDLLKRFDIAHKADAYPENLSGGQSQRVSVARSLVNNPEIILADEPTGNLDSISTKQVMDALEEINMIDKKTVVLITHNAAQLKYAHRVFYMNDGKVTRVVPNPEKKQIAKVDKQKMLVTEMEQLAKLYPYLSPAEHKVKSIINFLTQDFTFDQIVRMETYTDLMLSRKISRDKFYNILVTTYDKGGIGITRPTAEAMTAKIEKILRQAESIQRFRRRQEQGLYFNKEKEMINKMEEYLSGEYTGKFDPTQKARLRELLKRRVSGLIRKEEFKYQLSLSRDDGGIGVNSKTAEHLTVYYEKLLVQGMEDVPATH